MVKYEPTWNSLKKHSHPEWLDDAKFGIYFHWGIYSVPAFLSEWYPRHMYKNGTIWNIHHRLKYGKPSEFGYKDFIPQFTAEKFDADEWAKLFKEAGAKFAGPVAEHHDGFSMWNSKVNPWNATKMGPKRDLVGEFATAIRKHGMKFICTFHHSWNYYYYYHHRNCDTGDPIYANLYGPAHPAPYKNTGYSNWLKERPPREYNELWFEKLKEVIDGYHPDLIYFDFGLAWIPDNYKRKLVTYYYNKGEEWGKDVEILYKDNNLPPGVGWVDYERRRSDQITPYPWITDTSIGKLSWGYIRNEKYKTSKTVIHNFIDRLSKHGCLLLNFGPKPNGEIPNEALTRIKAIGEWININEEAIYGSTPWVLAEEGPKRRKSKSILSEFLEIKYSQKNIRFVTKGMNLYVFVLGWPGSELIIRSLTKTPKNKRKSIYYIIEESDIQSIYMVGYSDPLKWHLTAEGLKIQVPTEKPCDYAFVFKITWSE
jgi:alpha-L-fucosidase